MEQIFFTNFTFFNFLNFSVVKFSNWLINVKFNDDAFLVGSAFYYLATKLRFALKIYFPSIEFLYGT